jgi:hypothetical protein
MEENGREEDQGKRDRGEKCQIWYRKEFVKDRRKWTIEALGFIFISGVHLNFF